jgi:hypothetical protein
MATYTTAYPGNTSLETQAWTLTIAEGKQVRPFLQTTTGSYWARVLLRPMRKAIRAHAATFTIYTAFVTTGELSNALYASGAEMARACARNCVCHH